MLPAYGPGNFCQALPSWPKLKRAGWTISARISNESTRRGAGPVEIGVAVRHKDFSRLDGAQRFPSGLVLQDRGFAAGALQVEAARHEDEDVGSFWRKVSHSSPGECWPGWPKRFLPPANSASSGTSCRRP